MKFRSGLSLAICLAATLVAATTAAEPQQPAASDTLRDAFPDVFKPTLEGPPVQGASGQLRSAMQFRSPLQPPVTSPVCAMMILRGDSSIDPKILKPVPETGITPTMRVVEPTMCRPESAQESAPQFRSWYQPLRRNK